MTLKLVGTPAEWKYWWSIRWTLLSVFCSAVMVAYATLPADFLPEIPRLFKQIIGMTALVSSGAAAVAIVLRKKDAPHPED